MIKLDNGLTALLISDPPKCIVDDLLAVGDAQCDKQDASSKIERKDKTDATNGEIAIEVGQQNGPTISGCNWLQQKYSPLSLVCHFSLTT